MKTPAHEKINEYIQILVPQTPMSQPVIYVGARPMQICCLQIHACEKMTKEKQNKKRSCEHAPLSAENSKGKGTNIELA